MHVGAQATPEGVKFRVWAPGRRSVRVLIEETATGLAPERDGYFSGRVERAHAGMRYQYLLDDDPRPYPDPATRFQPEGPHGPSEIVDPGAYPWHHPRTGALRNGHVLYELHIGTFTEEGTFLAAIDRLPAIARLGVTAVEVMPIAEFAGRFNWGYDGVCLFAPSHVYGGPHGFRAFVDAAHAAGLGVILDVVYNHFGPDGNYHPRFSPYYRAAEKTEWGDGINFDGRQSRAVRDFVTANAAYWVREFRLDGLRLDATQSLHDTSEVHILADITRAARAAAAPEPLLIIGENEPQDTRLLQPLHAGGYGLDALWNDDFHHAARVALTRRNEAYMSGYRGNPQELISAARNGFLYQGQYFQWQRKGRGTPGLDLPASAFVAYLENHDQVANTGLGHRLAAICSPAELRALTALLLLGPATPMLFQGQEYGSQRPFAYFADHAGELAQKTRSGRLEFLAQFPSLTAAETRAAIPDPGAPSTFAQCKLRPDDSVDNTYRALHVDLIRLRKSDPAFAAQRADCIEGAVIGPHALALRFRVPHACERLLVVNLGLDMACVDCAEPLLAPPRHTRWIALWSSESVRYGGSGAHPGTDAGMTFQGRSAVVLGARQDE